MKKTIILFLLVAFNIHATAQSDAKANIGFGFGLDYGGFGAKFTFLPAPVFGVFGGFGYNLAGLGYNFGAQYKFPTKTRVAGYLTGMYGYNGVIVISGALSSKTSYYGPTFGGGIELSSKKNEKNFWNFELLVPFRDAQFQKDIDYWKSIGASITSPLPITISIGYHIRF